MTEQLDFWDAIAFAGGLPDLEELADTARYVRSRGHEAVDTFVREVDRHVLKLERAGVAQALASGSGATSDGRHYRDLASDELRECLQAVVLIGEHWYEHVRMRPAALEGINLPRVNLIALIEDAPILDMAPNVPLWEKLPGDLRKDGRPWLTVQLGTGVGVRESTSYLQGANFDRRLQKVARICSREAKWRAVRTDAGADSLELWIEYVPVSDEERSWVDRNRTRVDLNIDRNALHLDESVSQRELAFQEFDAFFEVAFAQFGK